MTAGRHVYYTSDRKQPVDVWHAGRSLYEEIREIQASLWQWRSTVLSSLDALFQLLRLDRAVPQDHLRVFSSSSREELDALLARENNGDGSASATAAQFLQERGIGVRARQHLVYTDAAGETGSGSRRGVDDVPNPLAYRIRKGACHMIYYRIALWRSQPAGWHWKSSPLTSLHPVLGWLHLYRGVPKEHIRVFLSTSPGQRYCSRLT